MRMTTRLSAILAATVILLPVLSHAGDRVPDWVDSIGMSGDLRLRYEAIRQSAREDRKRSRYRGRFKIDADVSGDVNVVFGLATGGDDPVSTNQTFGDGFSTKDIGVDLLYVNWKINEDFRFFGGKMKQPWYRAGRTTVLWDNDLNPEGAAVDFEHGRFFASAGGFLVEERSSDSNTMLYYGQGGVTFTLTDESSLTAGAGFFQYDDTAGFEPFFRARANGNTVDADGNYLFDYRNVELFAQYDTKLGRWPLTVFGEWIRNTEVDIEDTAYSAGFIVGKAKKQGTSQFSYAYHDTEADAAVGTFTDSDFAGGNTDSNGHYLRGRYVLRDNLMLGFTLILSEFGEFSGTEVDYDRLMLDFEVRF